MNHPTLPDPDTKIRMEAIRVLHRHDDTASLEPMQRCPPDDGGDGDDTAAVIEGTGYSRGDVAYNLSANDQNGLPFALHDRTEAVALVV